MWNSASTLSAIGNIGIAIALIAGVISAVSGAVSSIASGRAADIITRESNERIATADARAAEAKQEAAQANLRAEEAKIEAAKLHERLRKTQEMRTLSEMQAGALSAILKSGDFHREPRIFISVAAVADAEAEAFAHQINNLFYACDVLVGPVREAFQTIDSKSDVCFAAVDFEGAQYGPRFINLANAFSSLGISISSMQDNSLRQNELAIFVLKKPAV